MCFVGRIASSLILSCLVKPFPLCELAPNTMLNIGFSYIGFSDLGLALSATAQSPHVWIGPQHRRVLGECLEAARKSTGITQQQVAHQSASHSRSSQLTSVVSGVST
jgi:hypothetical protein